jgi:hypothetical protein
MDSSIETVESIDANHMQMARCNDRSDPSYRAIHGVLDKFLRSGMHGETRRAQAALLVEPQMEAQTVLEPRPIISQNDEGLGAEFAVQKRRLEDPTERSMSQTKRMRQQSTDRIGTARSSGQDCDLAGQAVISEGRYDNYDHEEEDSDDEDDSDDEEDDSDDEDSDKESIDENTGEDNTGYQHHVGPCYKCKHFNSLPKCLLY